MKDITSMSSLVAVFFRLKALEVRRASLLVVILDITSKRTKNEAYHLLGMLSFQLK
jgi:hypothetical protein